MKKVFIIDWFLIPSFIMCAGTGFIFHYAGHLNDHALWHNCAVAHILTSLFFLITVILHIKTHGGWYEGFFQRGIGRRSKLTILLTAIFSAVVITGLMLLGINGANSGVGLWHYKLGILICVISILHIAKRFAILRKALK